ncbi:unnamed protein product [Durusdinium trenchii]|uniref:Uncharacterized protein n=1 Tax=Durusdinium trenchii TaxID=1381693 RepID=A0ABP0PS75_9DINO
MSISGPPFSQYLWQCAQSPEEKPGTFFPDWAYNLKAFIPGAIVAVDKRSNLKHCHATVVTDISLCCGLGEDELCKALSTFKHPRREGEWMGDDPGRLLLEFSEAVRGYISVSRLTRVLPCSPARVLIVNETVSYRRLAKTQVGKVDGVLEIGSSFGECTQILTKHAAAVIGIDNSQELVEESRRRYPFCRIELLNCFQDPLQLQRLCSQPFSRSKGLSLRFLNLSLLLPHSHALVYLQLVCLKPSSTQEQPQGLPATSTFLYVGGSQPALQVTRQMRELQDFCRYWR